MMKIWAVFLAVFLVLSGVDAQAAKRFGGGNSMGKQSSNVTQRNAAPATPAAPAQNVGNAAAAKPAVPPPAVAPKRPWGAMLGGLAAGLGLAWLAHSMGMGEGFGQILMILLVLGGAFMLFKLFMASRKPAAASSSPFAFQGAGNAPVSVSKPYRPENVGNDASARPFERSSLDSGAGSTSSASGSMIGAALGGSQSWGVPEGFDSEGFLKAAKGNFITLQSAWDRSDIPALRALMTDSMLSEIQTQLSERESHAGVTQNQTDVVMIEAHLLGIEELADEYMASVEFSGMIREDPSAGPSPFREVWNMTKPKSGTSGWLVAGVQAMQ